MTPRYCRVALAGVLSSQGWFYDNQLKCPGGIEIRYRGFLTDLTSETTSQTSGVYQKFV